MKYKITMLCNEKQFKAIKPKLEGKVKFSLLSEFNSRQKFYLINHLGNDLSVTNVTSPIEHKEICRYEEWNEKIFLEACGIEVEKTFSITKEQILKLHENEASKYVKEWFPEVFKTVLEVGKWYKSDQGSLFNHQEKSNSYGFTSNGEYKSGDWSTKSEYYNSLPIEATKAEVFEALKNEAVKRYKNGDFVYLWHDKLEIKKILLDEFKYYKRDNQFFIHTEEERMAKMFDSGIWAEIVPTITKQEAEKQLGKKIID